MSDRRWIPVAAAARVAVVAALAAACALAVAGCVIDPGGGAGGTGGGGGGGGGGQGFGQPTLELTVAGVHYGPAAPSSGSSAQLLTMRDSTSGFTTSSSFYANVASSTGASCAIAVTAQGNDIYPIGVGAYQLAAEGEVTQNGQLMPIAGEQVETPSATLGCSGSQCDGAVLNIDQMDAQHVEGYLAATFGGQDVVCAFWLPWSTYQP